MNKTNQISPCSGRASSPIGETVRYTKKHTSAMWRAHHRVGRSSPCKGPGVGPCVVEHSSATKIICFYSEEGLG